MTPEIGQRQGTHNRPKRARTCGGPMALVSAQKPKPCEAQQDAAESEYVIRRNQRHVIARAEIEGASYRGAHELVRARGSGSESEIGR